MLAFMQFATSLAVDATSVYWTNPNDETVRKVPVGGGPTATLAGGAAPLAIDSTGVYCTNQFSTNPAPAILKMPLGGGAPAVIASLSILPAAIAVDATGVYWTSPGRGQVYFQDAGASELSRLLAPGSVMKISLDGGLPTVLASGQVGVGAIAIDENNVYWTAGTVVNFGTPQFRRESSVVKMPLGGGTPATFVSGQIDSFRIAVDAANIYWLNRGTGENGYTDGSVMKASLTNGLPITLATGQVNLTDMAIDATSVYWATMGSPQDDGTGGYVGDGAVMKVPLAGGTPTTIASGQLAAAALAIDATSVYWANDIDGSLMKATPR
jgi:hypothetical protein